jgi:photosystem II stability/assembly factor-like uncharacterized protein
MARIVLGPGMESRFMRTSLALLLVAALTPLAQAADLRFFNDAALHAVQFMDDGQEGWAAGDEGVIWHTIDGGKSWERQKTGVRASLRSMHFISPFIGWVVGREELPLAGGSAGVLLVTLDGGETWQRRTLNAMPGLNVVQFVNEKVGYVAGEGTDQYPSGVLMTRDCGKTWNPVPGPRCPGWSAASLTDEENGTFVGSWTRLSSLRRGQLFSGQVEYLGGRNVRGLYTPTAKDARSVAVGQGGLILTSGAKWKFAELLLPQEVVSCWDFHSVHGAGKHVWAAGRPGSVLLHSADGGQTWSMQSTGQPLTLNALFFHDEKHGWAVGELGLILNTSDGGQTWHAQRHGGKRAALLFVHAHSTGIPTDVAARLCEEGHLSTAVRVVTADPLSAPYRRAGEGDRLTAAMRLVGGAAGESLWQLPLPSHLNRESRETILNYWDDLHGGKASEQILRQLVLALRIWRPDVVVCDPTTSADAGAVAEILVADVMIEAFKKAGDPKAFPEQLSQLGLQAWKPSKLYALAENGSVVLSQTEVRARLEASPRQFAGPAAGLLAGQSVILPQKRTFQLLASNIEGAENHTSLFEGVKLSATGDTRRELPPVAEMTPELVKAIRLQTALQAFAELDRSNLTDPDRLLGALPKMLEQMPDVQGAVAAHAVASQMVRLGQWHLAREAFMQMTERYPMHPLTADAYRWLLKYNCSSEAQRRNMLGQFLQTGNLSYSESKGVTFKQDVLIGEQHDKNGKLDQDKDREKKPKNAKKPPEATQPRTVIEGTLPAVHATRDDRTLSASSDTVARWHKSSLELEKHLAGFGPLLAEDPSLQFCLQAARRSTGDFETSRKWFTDFLLRQPPGPWRDAAAAELWLTRREGQCPKPILCCKQTETRPFLDGKFDDRCWQEQTPTPLRDASGTTAKESPTKVMLAYDNEFLYLALRCEHPPRKAVKPVKGRKRDEDLRAFDRVSLLLDLDRDYATAFQLEVDERGCVRDSCWGDLSWNPSWFVAVHGEENAWQIEAAIPLGALTGDMITSGKTWCCNVIRTIPGQGVQGWSLPAGMPEEDARLEGMGLLMFKGDARQEAREQGKQMKRVQK